MFITVFSGFGQNIDQGEKLKTLMRMIRMYYTDSVDENKIADAAIVKMLEELDPHSAYIPKKDVSKTEEGLKGSFEGVGISFLIYKDTLLVQEVISGGPSEKVGIMANDKIIMVNDTNIAGKGIKNDDVFRYLRGPKGTIVDVTILRGKNLLDFRITRDKIPIYSVDAAYMASPTTGYIKVNKFAATTIAEFEAALQKLQAKGMKNLILDLQENGGGYLNTAFQLCNEFIPDSGEMIVYTEGKHAPRESYTSDGKGKFSTGKLVVMINEGSASASEILSGCMQDLDRGVLVGRRSFGKGLVQKPFSFADGSVVRLTVSHYYTPSGRCIQRPYENGKKDYYDEYSRRLKSGELFGKDSFSFPDSLTYYTKARRKVYGGGGVIPDVIVPLDTTWTSDYYSKLVRKGILNNFVLEYTNNNRENLLEKYPTGDDFVSRFAVTNEILNSLQTFAEKDSLMRDSAQFDKSKIVIETNVKAMICRNLYENGYAVQIFNQINDSYKKAVAIIDGPQYDAIINSGKATKKEIRIERKKERKEKKEKIK